jgi:hypothetical protein
MSSWDRIDGGDIHHLPDFLLGSLLQMTGART